ncbi:histidine phosphatase family protein [Nocardioides albidus]|uniref:Histidine phosphatase family protein n=1 Tax=Nocardioides albidus TaxID=1517589 RepID=A0A5C4VL64_9ACTN|nr:histidine phosphatase family protein [Nocardioides albidus]TNM36542.1 histidine phosphatase family protein [Nocardioides albidus]
MRLLLLRHGQTTSNVAGALDTGTPGADLTELGRAQAEAAAAVLADRDIASIHCSTLVRTQQTAAPLAQRLGLRPTIHDGLREITAGDLEMRTDTASAHAYRHLIASWLLEGDLDARLPGGETAHDFLERYDAAIDEIRATTRGTALVVSHGAAIRSWVGLRGGDIPEHLHELAVEYLQNTGCIELTDDSGRGWEIVDWLSHPVGGHLLEDDTAADPTGRAPE